MCQLANLHGANRAYIETEIPHIASLMADSIDTVLANSDVIIIGNRSKEFAGRALTRLREDQVDDRPGAHNRKQCALEWAVSRNSLVMADQAQRAAYEDKPNLWQNA